MSFGLNKCAILTIVNGKPVEATILDDFPWLPHDEGYKYLGCSPLCRLCQQKDKTVWHIVSACPKLAGTKYTKHHNDVVLYIHWNLLKEWGIEVPAQ